MSMPYSPTSPNPKSMFGLHSQQKLPFLSKIQYPDGNPHARPQSPPLSPESMMTGSSQSSPKRRMSEQHDPHDLLDQHRRKRSATSAHVLGSASSSSSSLSAYDDSRRDLHLPSPRTVPRPDDRPQLPPLQTYLQACKTDTDVPAHPLPTPGREPYYYGSSSAAAAHDRAAPTRLPPIVTNDYPPPQSVSKPAPAEPGPYGGKSALGGPRSALPSPYGPPGPSASSSAAPPYGERRRESSAGDYARSHPLPTIAGSSAQAAYDAYPPPPSDRRYSAPYAQTQPPPPQQPPSQQQQAGAPSHYRPGAPPQGPGPDMSAHYVWEMPVAAINPNGRKRRGNLPKESTSILNDWFCQHINFPYPKEDEKHQLQAMTGLSISQISNWFINARRRRRPEAVMRQAQAHPPYDDDAPMRWKPSE